MPLTTEKQTDPAGNTYEFLRIAVACDCTEGSCKARLHVSNDPAEKWLSVIVVAEDGRRMSVILRPESALQFAQDLQSMIDSLYGNWIGDSPSTTEEVQP